MLIFTGSVTKALLNMLEKKSKHITVYHDRFFFVAFFFLLLVTFIYNAVFVIFSSR